MDRKQLKTFWKNGKDFLRGAVAAGCSLSAFLALLTSGCVKQHDCDCGSTGKFVYLEEPYKTWELCGGELSISSIFYNDNGEETHLSGFVPGEYRDHDTLRVRLCTKVKSYPFACVDHGHPKITIQCIERE